MVTDTSQETPQDDSDSEEAGVTASQENGAKGAADAMSELQNKVQDSEKKYLYLYSEFENFRRRTERDRLDFLKFGHEGFLRDLLQVLDNFERAIEHAKSVAGEKGSPAQQIGQGVEMIHYQFLEALKNQGVTTLSTVGSKFDPSLHEAVGEEDADAEAGTVLKEAQKGYMLHGRLLRPARVIVAKRKN